MSDRDDIRADALETLRELVAFPTVTGTPNLDLIAYAEARLGAVGAELRRTVHPSGERANLLATIGPAVDGGVVLSGHTDVVPPDVDGWTDPAFSATLRDGRIYGRGTADMKGFLACAIAMAPRFAAAGLRVPIHLALSYDEEVGCQGAPLLIEDLVRHGPMPAAAIVGEPTLFRIIHGHKGCYEYTTTITGVEGHGSAPAKGVNAVEWGARYVDHLLELARSLAEAARDDDGYDPHGTTINVGTISGGTARNVVAGSCTVEWEFRPVTARDATFVLDDLAAFEAELDAELRSRSPGASLVRTVAGEVGGLEPEGAGAAVDLVRGLLDDAEVGVVPFGTEAGLFQEAGIPTVVCGPGSIDVAHRPDEYLSLEQIERCLDLMERLTDHLSTPADDGRS